MYTCLFLAILPVLLGTFAPSLALPVQSSRTLSIGARSFDFSSDTIQLVSRDVDTKRLVERGYEDDESDVLSRAINEDLFPRANKPKETAAEAKQHKADVKPMVTTNQANNSAKKNHLQGKAAKRTEAAYVNFLFLISDTKWRYHSLETKLQADVCLVELDHPEPCL